MTPESIEQIILNLKLQHDKLLEDYPETFIELMQDKQLSILTRENKQIMDEFKRLNEFMTFLVDYHRSSIAFFFNAILAKN